LQERLAVRHPRDRLLGVFDVMAEVAVESNFGGCAFIARALKLALEAA